MLPKSKLFLTKTELVIFILLFGVFLFLAFPKHILPELLKKDYSETSIKYLENLVVFYPHNSRLTFLLIDKYIKLGDYKKADALLSKQKKDYKRYYYEYMLAKRLYFEKKGDKKHIKNILSILAEYAKNSHQKEFIYKEARSFEFLPIELKMLKDLNKTSEYIDLALYLKKYNLVINLLQKELKKDFNESYFNKLVNIALFKSRLKTALSASIKYHSHIKTTTGYNNLLRVGILAKNRFLIKYAVNKSNNINFKLQGFLILKDYNNALKIAQQQKNSFLIAEIYLWKKDYSNALKYFMKNGFHKNIKVITSLAYLLHKYDILEKILLNKIKHGDYKKVKDLTYVYLENAEIDKGIKIFTKMYNRTKKDIFLEALFKIYYAVGDDENIKKIVWKFKKLPLYIAFYASDAYLSERDFQSAFKIMKKVHSNKYEYYKRLFFIADKLGDDKEKIKILKKMEKIKKTPQTLLSMFFIYLKTDKLKAFNYLQKNYIPSDSAMYQLLKTAYELKKYKFIVSFKPHKKTDFYYVYLINSLKALHYKNVIIKETYLKAINEYPQMKENFYWFLLDSKDKDIKQYLNDIKNKQILLGAYLLLNKKYDALNILRELLKKENNIRLWMDYYYLTDNEKIKFMIYKKFDNLIRKNRNALFDETILDFYFYNSLRYKPDFKIRRILYFIKKHNLNYKKYHILYLQHIRAYEKLKVIR